MRHIILAAVAATALAGCGQPAEPEPPAMSREEVASALQGLEIAPGLWESSREVIRIEVADMPEELARGLVGRTDTVRHCISPEQAARPDANFLAGQEEGECTYRGFALDGARMRGTAICTGEGVPGTRTINMAGEYRPERYDVTVEVTERSADGSEARMEARRTGQRIGDCP